MVIGIKAVNDMPSRAQIAEGHQKLENLAAVKKGVETIKIFAKQAGQAASLINERQNGLGFTKMGKGDEVATLEASKASHLAAANEKGTEVLKQLKEMGYAPTKQPTVADLESLVAERTYVALMSSAQNHSGRADAFAALKRDFAIATAVIGLALALLTTANLLPVDLGKAGPAADMLAKLPVRVGAGAFVFSGVVATGIASGKEKSEAKKSAEQFVAAHDILPARSLKETFEQAEAGASVMKVYDKIRPATDDLRAAVDTLKPEPTTEGTVE